MNKHRLLAVTLILFAGACGSSGANGPGAGGSSGGGTVGTGGQSGSGGAAGTNAPGGAGGAGGGAAGNSATGGTSGGTAGSGGAAGTGAAGTSGSAGAAGSAGAGGRGGQAGGAGGASAGSGGSGDGGRGGAAGGGGAAGRGGAAGGGSGGGGTGGATAAFDRAAVMAIMRRVADYEITRFGTGNSNGWVRATFHTGMLAAYRALGDAKYHDYTLQWAQANSWLVSTDDSHGPRFADNQACFQSYAELYLESPVAANSVRIASAQTVLDSMVAAPMAGRTEWWWCDALFMAPGGMARLAQATGKTQYLTLMNNMFWDTKAFLYDPAQSLFWRDSTFVNTNTYWSRGNGWVVAGITRVLDYLPATDARRPDYETLLRQMATKLASIQASDGFWRSSLTQPNAFTTPESSGTAFFCYGIAWGINHGVLDRATFLPVVTKAWAALGTAVNAQGRLGWVQAVGAQPGASTVDNTNDYATGAFLLAGSEILKL